MGNINKGLQKKLDVYIATSTKKNSIYNTEDEMVEFINSIKMFHLQNAVVNFRLDVKKIISNLSDTELINIKITNCSFPKGISFYECKIRENFYFWENQCSGCDFSHCEIKGYSYFSNTVFLEDVTFDYTTFFNDSFFWGVEFKKEASFRDCDFQNRIDFWCSEFRYRTDFNHSAFRKDVDFSNCIFNYDVFFQNTILGEEKQEGTKIVFDNANFDKKISFNNSNFKTEISFSKVISKSDIEFEKCSFWHPIISNNSILNNLSFKQSHFYSPLYLTEIKSVANTKIDFSKIWSASLISIECNAPQEGYKTKIDFLFNQSIFSKFSITQIAGIAITDDVFYCNGCIILGVFSIKDSYISEMQLRDSSIIGSVVLKSHIENIDLTNSAPSGRILTNSNYCINPKNRDTANILRHEKEKEGDIILALQYREIEMKLYNKDLSNLAIKKRVEKIEENIIVKLNFLSNKYGQSWVRGVVFTSIIAVVSIIILQFITGEISFTGAISDFILIKPIFWKEALLFLWLPSTSLESIYDYGLLYLIIYVLGKILIAYGIIQTVLSFRKYSKI